MWWDIRPSPALGTLELRFCDQPATLREAMAIVAFAHCLAHWFRDHEAEWTQTHNPLKRWIIRENKWRVIRFGLQADIVVSPTGKTKRLSEDIEDWLDAVADYARRLNYTNHISTIHQILSKGNSASRQHQIFADTHDLMAVVKHNVREFELQHPVWE